MSREITSAFSWRENSPAETLYLYFGGLYVGCVIDWSNKMPPDGLPKFRAWIMTDDDGAAIGWFRSEVEAQSALLKRAMDLLPDQVTEHNAVPEGMR